MTHLFDRERWIAHLPKAEEEAAIDLVLMGWILPSPAGWTCVVTGDLCLTFAEADVLSCDLLDESQVESEPARARLQVRQGAALWDVRPRECVDHMLPSGRRPFAISSRPLSRKALPLDRFPKLEEEFLVRTAMRPRGSP